MKNGQTKKEPGPVQEKMAWYIAGRLLKLQQGWAEVMGRMAACLSVAQQKTALIILGGMMAVFCTWLVYRGFAPAGTQRTKLVHEQITVPALPESLAGDRPSEALIVYFRKVGAYMDSLRKNGTEPRPGQLENMFPGLKDSIQVFESLENEKYKTKKEEYEERK